MSCARARPLRRPRGQTAPQTPALPLTPSAPLRRPRDAAEPALHGAPLRSGSRRCPLTLSGMQHCYETAKRVRRRTLHRARPCASGPAHVAASRHAAARAPAAGWRRGARLEVHRAQLRRPAQQEGGQHVGQKVLHAAALGHVRVPQPHRQRERHLAQQQAVDPPARPRGGAGSGRSARQRQAVSPPARPVRGALLMRAHAGGRSRPAPPRARVPAPD